MRLSICTGMNAFLLSTTLAVNCQPLHTRNETFFLDGALPQKKDSVAAYFPASDWDVDQLLHLFWRYASCRSVRLPTTHQMAAEHHATAFHNLSWRAQSKSLESSMCNGKLQTHQDSIKLNGHLQIFWKSGALSVSCDIRPRSACTEYLQTQRWASPPLTKLVPAAAQNLVEGVRILDQVYYTKGGKEDNYIINQMLNPNLRTSCMSQRLNWNPSNGSSRWILVVVACRSSH